MKTSTFPQFPDYRISVSLFENVRNSKDLRMKVGDLPFALIDARLICTTEQLYSAIYRALIEVRYNRMRTKSLQSECLFSLSPTSNIGEAFKVFGIKEDSTELICVRIDASEGDAADNSIFCSVEGTEVDFQDQYLIGYCDENAIRKAYKLGDTFQPDTIEGLSRALVNAIQLRGL